MDMTKFSKTKRFTLLLFLAVMLLGTITIGHCQVTSPKFKAWDSNSNPLVGGALYSYVTGTSTPTNTYSNSACTIPNTNPVILDSQGEAAVYIKTSAKLVLKSQAGVSGVLLWTIDGVSAGNLWTYYPPGVTVLWGNVIYGGTQAGIEAAISEIGSDNRSLYLAPGTWNITSDLNIPSNIFLKLERGVVLSVATTKTLTINGPLDAGRYQIISCTGTGKVVFGNGAVDYVRPEWWGAVGDGSTDCTNAIKAAIGSLSTAVGGVVTFLSGTYLVTPGQIVVGNSGVWLKGSGRAVSGGQYKGTIIKSATGTGKVISFLGSGVGAGVLVGCGVRDLSIWGDYNTVQGLSLTACGNFLLDNVGVFDCLDDGIYLEQVWDSSFLCLIATNNASAGKFALHVKNGAIDNNNNLRFYAPHLENNLGDADVWIDATGSGLSNYQILFDAGKFESDTQANRKAVYISSGGSLLNDQMTFRDCFFTNYYGTGSIPVHWTGAGCMTVDGCYITNDFAGGTAIKIEGPYIGDRVHQITNNNFAGWTTEIDVESTWPRGLVWDDGNRAIDKTGDRISINGTLQRNRRNWTLISQSSSPGVGTSGTGEDNLYTYTLPAGLLSTFGGLKVQASGWVNGGAGNHTVKFYFGTSTITLWTGAVLGTWQLEAWVNSIAANHQIVNWVFRKGGIPAVVNSGLSEITVDTSADTTIKMTGECINGADTIYQMTWVVKEW